MKCEGGKRKGERRNKKTYSIQTLWDDIKGWRKKHLANNNRTGSSCISDKAVYRMRKIIRDKKAHDTVIKGSVL